MKKLYSLLFILFVVFSASARQQWIGFTSNTPRPALIERLNSDLETTIIKASIPGFYRNDVVTPRGNAYSISLDNSSPMLVAGAPDLAKLTAAVIIPDRAKMAVQVISETHYDIPGYEIAPSKGTVLRNVSKADVPFSYGSAYSRDGLFPGRLASLQSPYIMRDYRGQSVWIYPFQYNPATKTLRVYTEMTIQIVVVSQDGENPFYRTKALTSMDNDFRNIYASHFINYNAYHIRSYTPVDETGSLLIISDPSFMSSMQPLIDWKIKRGLPVEMVSVATAGGTAAAIQTYIASYYSTHNLKYVLLVGDAAQVPTLTVSGGASDPSYGFIVGNDSYPEVFVGRFSAESVADVQTQVARVVNYERYPQAGAAWYGHGVGIASNLGPGDDNEYDWEHERNIRGKLLTFGYADVAELYDGTHGIEDAAGDPMNTDLINVLNSGVSMVNYTGHGSQTTFVTTNFSVSNMTSLTNANMLPFVFSVGCVNGDFTSGTCLAESFMRSNNSGQPTGALTTFMSSINQYWDEPMRAQDEMVDLLVGTHVGNVKRTLGGLCENGCMNMNDVYGTTGYDMTNTWHIFGDPSIPIRTATPVAINCSHVSFISLGATDLVVNADMDGALISVTAARQIIGTGIISSGSVDITFPALSATDTLFVTATGFNGIPCEDFVIVTDPAAVTEINVPENAVTVFPNPAHGNVTIAANLAKGSLVSMKIYNSLGEEVKSLTESFAAGENHFTLNAEEFAKGVYYLRVEENAAVLNKMFIIE